MNLRMAGFVFASNVNMLHGKYGVYGVGSADASYLQRPELKMKNVHLINGKNKIRK
jgi:hypothetical protein